jgi:hypothetical protein
MNHEIDNERAAVYAAELAAFDGTDLEVVLGSEAIVSLVANLTEGEWWPGPRVDVRRARADAQASSATCLEPADVVGWTVVRFAAEQTTVATAAHEVAHALAGLDFGHGPVFRRAYLDVVCVITNLDSTNRRGGLHVGQLADAFAMNDLSIGDRLWVEPALDGPIPL